MKHEPTWAARTHAAWMRRTRAQFAGSTFKGPKRFTLDQYRSWVQGELGGCWERHCFYCDRIVTVETFRPDHIIPLARGGENHLENLVIACEPCNATKGKLTAGEYEALRRGLATFSLAARADIVGRLRKASSAVPGLLHLQQQRAKGKRADARKRDSEAPAV